MRALCLLLLVCACKPSDPRDPRTWEKRLADQKPEARIEAIHRLRELKAREAAPQIARLLQDPVCKEDAAVALADLGGPPEVQPLLGAIDTTVGAGSGQATRSADRANAKIAEALGDIGSPEAAPSLLRLSRASDDNVRLAAIEALGKLRSREAVQELSHVADDPSSPPLLVKKALTALGLIGAPAGIPALLHGLVFERQGVSFLPEASYSLLQMGSAAVDPLLRIAQDQDLSFLAWAKDNDRPAAGIYARAALVLGDIEDPRAIPALLAKLKYTDPDPQPGTSRLLSDLVRGAAARALGRLRAKEAAAPIQAIISAKDEGDLPRTASLALVFIGDRAQAKELLKKAATAGPRGRQALSQAAALLGEPALAKELQTLASKVAGKGLCAKELAELGQPENERPCEAVAKPLRDAAAALQAAKDCDAPACWLGKLKDPLAAVRARAAVELGRASAGEAVPALAELCGDDDPLARSASIRALDWLISVPAAKSALHDAAQKLSAQLAPTGPGPAGDGRSQPGHGPGELDSPASFAAFEDLRALQFKLAAL
jgi:HEAT repeat protein